jgi:hypothetical protein
MTDLLAALRDLIQDDPGGRGLRTDPQDNLLTACPGDFASACRGIATTPEPSLAVVTGFYIAHATPPCGETDGPPGAVFLARALVPLGIKVVLATDPFCLPALEAGVNACGLRKAVPLVRLPTVKAAGEQSVSDYVASFLDRAGPLTHLIAVERCGPSHTADSLRAQPGAAEALVADFLARVPPADHDRYHNSRGLDITSTMSPAHRLFEAPPGERPFTTIGIGDGGNEIGMGKVGWDVIRRNIPRGEVIACRVPADHLIVCGVSNWGAYALAAGVRLLRGAGPDPDLFDPAREQELLQLMVERGPLVDGPSGRPEAVVDGLPPERNAAVLRRLGEMLTQGARE